MADSYSFKVGLVKVEADAEPVVYLTNNAKSFFVGADLYTASPEMDLTQLPVKSGAATAQEGRIDNISVLSPVIANIAGGYPYTQIKVEVSEVELDEDFNVLATHVHFNGLVYQSSPSITTGKLSLIIKDWKYYTDITAGFPCTEQCFVKHFGDTLCQAVVNTYPVVPSGISGYVVILTAVPSVVDRYFNKGYFNYKGTSIKIKYWETGTSFITSEAMPASWEGQTINLVAGCDKQLETCRTIHNNEEHFSGWGYSMIDYDPQFEDPSV